MKATRPNIVIFMASQWRGDWTGISGHPAVRTPNLDQFAQTGTYFNRAFATNPAAAPSRCSIGTGWYPHSRGLRSEGARLDTRDAHLFRYLHDAGYHVAYGGRNEMLTDRAIAESVDTRFAPLETRSAQPVHQGKMSEPVESHPDVQVIRQAQAFIRTPTAEPYCLWVNVGLPRPPYAVPDPYYSMYRPQQIPPPMDADHAGLPDYVSLLREAQGDTSLDLHRIAKLRAIYTGMVTMTDSLLGDLLKTMDDADATSRCATVVTADHGDYTGDYGLAGSWVTGCHDAVLRVPLAIRLPGGAGIGVTDALVQHVDLLPTLLDLAGITPHTTHFGRSLAPILMGKRQSIRDAVFADAGANIGYDTKPVEDSLTLATRHRESASRTMMARTDRWKYVWRQIGREELYDLHNDPYETKNLLTHPMPDIEAVRVQMQALMLRWCTETGDVLMPPSDATADRAPATQSVSAASTK